MRILFWPGPVRINEATPYNHWAARFRAEKFSICQAQKFTNLKTKTIQIAQNPEMVS